MKRRNRITLLLMTLAVFIAVTPLSSQAYTLSENAIDYYAGNIPVIISVPHGGTYTGGLEPYDPYYCHGGVTDPDPKTIELALKIQAAFGARFKKANGETAKPYIVINNWKRKYLDANRDPGHNNREIILYDLDASDPGYTQDQDITINPYDCLAYFSTGSRNVWAALACKKAWYSYNDFIDLAKKQIINANPNQQILYIDLHSQTHESQLFELGYFVTAEEFDGVLPDKSATSLRRLATGCSLENLLIGETDNPTSFGGIFEKLVYDDITYNGSAKYEGLSSECTPSPANPEPPTGGSSLCIANYYAGGWNLVYNTVVDRRLTHISLNSYQTTPLPGHEKTSGLQVEVPNVLINQESDTNRRKISKVMVDSIDQFLNKYYGYNIRSIYPRQGSETVWPSF